MPRPRLLGPLLRFELLTSARRVRYYALRGGYVAVLGFILWIAYQLAVAGSGGNTGTNAIRANAAVATNFAAAFGYAQLAAALLLTVALSAPALTTEKERRTIDYLLTTDLTDRELVFGKYAARLFVAGLPVVAGMGLLGICQVFGGLDPGEILALTVVTLATMLSVGALALLVSVRLARTRDAILTAYFLAAFLLAAPHAVDVSASYWRAWTMGRVAGSANKSPPEWLVAATAAAERMLWAEPFHLVYQRGVGKTRLGANEDLRYFATVHGTIAALCLTVAWLTVRGRRRKELAGAGAAGPAASWWRRRFGPRVRLGRLPPVVWKEYFFSRAMAFWPTLLVGLGSFAWLFFCAGQALLGNDAGLLSSIGPAWRAGAVAFGLWTTLAVAIRAATAIPTEVAQDTWAFLLATPLRPSAIVLGKAFGALRPLAMYGGFLALGAAAAWVGNWDATAALAPTFGAVAGASVFFAGVGLWIGAGSQKTGPALLGTLAVFALFNGLGQLVVALASALLTLALQSQALSFDFAWEGWAMSFPGALLWQASGAGRPADPGANFTRAALAWGVGYPLLGAAFLAIVVRSFPRLVGRGEGPRRPDGETNH